MTDSALSIVVLNYNTQLLLATCLDSIRKYASQAQVIVVDNASIDGSAEWVARNFPNAILIANKTNVGFASGVNAGIRQASARFVLTLNADTELCSTTLAPLLETMERFPRAGIVGPVQCLPSPGHLGRPSRMIASAFPDPTLAREAARLLLFSDSFAARFKLGPWRIHSGAPRAFDYLLGAALLFRRDCLDVLGGFDESQFMYGEDWEICYRARLGGWQVYLVPESEIIHHENASGQKSFGIQRGARVLEANLYYHEKHFGRTSRRVLAFVNLIGAGFRILLFWLFDRLRARGQFEQARIAWRAMWR